MSFQYEFPRMQVVVDILLVRSFATNYEVLLIQRGKDPYKGKLALPGGFVNMDETLEVAARRELKEETGLEVKCLHLLNVYDHPDRDPRDRTISICYGGTLNGEHEPQAGDDAATAAWVLWTPNLELAFDHKFIVNQNILYNHKVLGKSVL
jgi:8-oxo-dGTP diphosphatase